MNGLRRLYIERGFSAASLARRLETSGSLISRWETGKYQPGLRSLLALARVLDVSLEEVVGALLVEAEEE